MDEATEVVKLLTDIGGCGGRGGSRLCGKHGGSDLGQLAPRRPLPVPDRASGGPELRPASANQPLGPRWPAI